MVPLIRVIPQWSPQMSSRLTKGWKRIRAKWVLRMWSHQINFKETSSRKSERGRPLGGVGKKAKGNFLG
jgi:hypothetical protein